MDPSHGSGQPPGAQGEAKIAWDAGSGPVPPGAKPRAATWNRSPGDGSSVSGTVQQPRRRTVHCGKTNRPDECLKQQFGRSRAQDRVWASPTDVQGEKGADMEAAVTMRSFPAAFASYIA
jgi:hypothetical protein